MIKTTQIGPRCAISELKERRKAARPSPTNAATQDAAPVVRVARRACFLCAKRAPPPPEKAAARIPTTKKSRALGKHAQRRRISRAGRACAQLAPPSQHTGPSVSKQHKRQREAAAHSRSHSAHEEGKERARRRRSDSAGGRRRKAQCSWVPLRDACTPVVERRAPHAHRRAPQHKARTWVRDARGR